jgi:predicted ester cyclase
MGQSEPRQVVERYLEGDEDLLADVTLRKRAEAFRSAFPDARVTAEQVLADKDLVCVHLTGSGTHLGTFQGCPPTGREWIATCTAIYRIEAGRIAEAWINWDWLAVMEQLGCVQRVETVSA